MISGKLQGVNQPNCIHIRDEAIRKAVTLGGENISQSRSRLQFLAKYRLVTRLHDKGSSGMRYRYVEITNGTQPDDLSHSHSGTVNQPERGLSER